MSYVYNIRCLFDYTNNTTKCGDGCVIVDRNKELKVTTHGAKVLKEISDKMPLVNNNEMIQFNTDKRKVHHGNMMNTHSRYKELVEHEGECVMFSNRTKHFKIPQILIARDDYDITEVLAEYDKEWSIFKSKLCEFKALKNCLESYEDDCYLKDWSSQTMTINEKIR